MHPHSPLFRRWLAAEGQNFSLLLRFDNHGKKVDLCTAVKVLLDKTSTDADVYRVIGIHTALIGRLFGSTAVADPDEAQPADAGVLPRRRPLRRRRRRADLELTQSGTSAPERLAPALVDPPRLPDHDRAGPGDEEEADDHVAELLEVERVRARPRSRESRPKLRREDLQQLDRADRERDRRPRGVVTVML